LIVSTGTCGAPQEATFVCSPDATGELVVSFDVPPDVENFSVLDFTAVLVAQDGADCAVETQSILVVCEALLPTKPPETAPPTPTPSPLPTTPCDERQCKIEGYESAPCDRRNVEKMHATCYGGRCRAFNAKFDVDCHSDVCVDSADGTPCGYCDCACGAIPADGGDGSRQLVLRDCCDAPTPAPSTTGDDDDDNSGANQGDSPQYDGHDPHHAEPVCGNGILEDGEECDGDEGHGIFLECSDECRLEFFWPALAGVVLSSVVAGGCVLWLCFRAMLRRYALATERRRRRRERDRREAERRGAANTAQPRPPTGAPPPPSPLVPPAARAAVSGMFGGPAHESAHRRKAH